MCGNLLRLPIFFFFLLLFISILCIICRPNLYGSKPQQPPSFWRRLVRRTNRRQRKVPKGKVISTRFWFVQNIMGKIPFLKLIFFWRNRMKMVNNNKTQICISKIQIIIIMWWCVNRNHICDLNGKTIFNRWLGHDMKGFLNVLSVKMKFVLLSGSGRDRSCFFGVDVAGQSSVKPQISSEKLTTFSKLQDLSGFSGF